VEERTLIQRLQQGSQPALKQLIDLYSAYISTIVRNIIGDRMGNEDIEEVVSDAFVLLWSNAARLQENGTPKSYLAAIARNQALKKLRDHDPRVRSLEEEFNDIAGASHDPLEESESRQELQWAMSTMDKEDREIFLRYYYFFEKTKDIALRLNMNESTVRSRLLRGRTYLKQRLTEGGCRYDGVELQNG
jgi:RNA polymerase sigma-70 factor (ECF subfamily)